MLLDLTGKKILVTGIANNRSIAWGIAQQLRAAGAEDVPRLLHRHPAQTRPVHVDDLVSNQEPAVPATSEDLKKA